MSVRLRLTANRRTWTDFTITALCAYGKTTSRISRKAKFSRASENIVSCPLRTCALRGYGIKIRRQKRVPDIHRKRVFQSLCFFLPLISGTGGASFFGICVLWLLSVPCGSLGSGRRIPAFAILITVRYSNRIKSHRKAAFYAWYRSFPYIFHDIVSTTVCPKCVQLKATCRKLTKQIEYKTGQHTARGGNQK